MVDSSPDIQSIANTLETRIFCSEKCLRSFTVATNQFGKWAKQN